MLEEIRTPKYLKEETSSSREQLKHAFSFGRINSKIVRRNPSRDTINIRLDKRNVRRRIADTGIKNVISIQNELRGRRKRNVR